MIDTDKYEGHIQGEWRDTRHEGALAHHIVAYNPQIAYANDAGDVQICTVSPNEATANLVTDAPLLLEEVKRLREAIADIANNMEAADPSYLQGFIRDLLEVIE